MCEIFYFPPSSRRSSPPVNAMHQRRLRQFLVAAVCSTPISGAFSDELLVSDFSFGEDASVTMEWTDASGAVHMNANNIIPRDLTSSTGGAFPAGSIRWTNLVIETGQPFDLLVTTSVPPPYYSPLIDVEYWSPNISQAGLTGSGFACLGFGLRTSTCASGASLDSMTADCADGSPTTMRGDSPWLCTDVEAEY